MGPGGLGPAGCSGLIIRKKGLPPREAEALVRLLLDGDQRRTVSLRLQLTVADQGMRGSLLPGGAEAVDCFAEDFVGVEAAEFFGEAVFEAAAG